MVEPWSIFYHDKTDALSWLEEETGTYGADGRGFWQLPSDQAGRANKFQQNFNLPLREASALVHGRDALTMTIC